MKQFLQRGGILGLFWGQMPQNTALENFLMRPSGRIFLPVAAGREGGCGRSRRAAPDGCLVELSRFYSVYLR